MRIFIERPITSVEDAEGLPVGTVAISVDPVMETGRIRVKSADPDLYGARWSFEEDPSWFRDDQMVGFTALVPVEATEETLAGHAVTPDGGPDLVRRLVTSWEATR